MPSAEVYIATSLDGYIARPDGDIGWLVGQPVPESEDFGYAAFMAGIGALVMGRVTYEKALTFPEWPYRVPIVVMSRSPSRIVVPEDLSGKATVTEADPSAILRDLAVKGTGRIHVDGGQVVRAFLADGLIRRMIVTLIPVLLGEGLPLWGHGPGDIGLRLVSVRQWQNGYLQLEYAL